jgi:hypothetical protein
LILKIAKESPDRSKPSVACTGAVAATNLYVVEELAHEIRSKVFNAKLTRTAAEPIGRKPNQQ